MPENKKSRTDLTYDKKYIRKWGRRRGTKIGVFYTFFRRNFFLAKYLTIMHAFELFHLQKQRVFKIFIIVVLTTEIFFTFHIVSKKFFLNNCLK